MVVNESALEALRDRISSAEQQKEIHTGKSAPSFKKEIIFKNVSFAYEKHNTLENITLSFPANKFHLIIGGSGAGKTTLIDMLVGFHKPKTGEVLIDDQSLENLDIGAWRSMIGYVPQQFLLFHDSIAHNVSLGDEKN